jgi:hypothetical protein
MIILRLRGGLGNQLFQYAAASALAEHHGTPLKLDLYYYQKHPYRKFDLDKLNVPFEEATRAEVHAFTGSNLLQRFLNKRENYWRCARVFAQPHYHFFADWFRLPAALYLSGYFQSEKFFTPLADQVRTWYTPRVPLDPQSRDVVARMQETNSVSLHVRRGDYNMAQFNAFFRAVPLPYYQQAVDRMQQTLDGPQFFIFSDDVAWCREHLKIEGSPVFVDHNRGADSYRDLLLMAHAKHNIIANSSFSWWGAWLNPNPAKQVIAPQPWFGQEYFMGKEPVYSSRYYNTDDLIPKGWVVIESVAS